MNLIESSLLGDSALTQRSHSVASRKGLDRIRRHWCTYMTLDVLQSAVKPALNRIAEALSHWGAAAAKYHDPEGFRIAINACIQSIRNITFSLQSQKSSIENFEKWYGLWQEAMRNDFIMRWCQDARNQIVKQSDLETHSIALASAVNDYREPPTNTFKVSPFATSHEIAVHLRNNILPNHLEEHAYLYVERRWIVDSLSSLELLEALAYVLSFLRCLLIDAVAQRGPTAYYGTGAPPTPEQFKQGEIDDTYLPEFATSFREERSTWLKLSSSAPVRIIDNPREVRSDELENANSRYQLEDLVQGLNKTKTDLKSRVEFFLAIGKQMLEMDGYHRSVVLLFDRKELLSILTPEFPDHEDKLIIWRYIAKQAKRAKATMVIAIAEAWRAPLDSEFPHRHPEHSPERIEILRAAALTNRGDGYAICIPFWREAEKIRFGKEEELSIKGVFFLEPFRRVWRKTKTMRTPNANKGKAPRR